MKLCSKILATAVIAASVYSLSGCGAPASSTGSGLNPQNATIKLTALTDSGNGINPNFSPGLVVSDGAIAAGSNVLTSATAGFNVWPVGTTIDVYGAGPATSGPITAYSISTSNVLTLTAANSLTISPAQTFQITLSGFPVSTFLNGVTVTVTAATPTTLTAHYTPPSQNAGASAVEQGTYTFLPNLVATITTVVNNTTVDLSANASTTITGAQTVLQYVTSPGPGSVYLVNSAISTLQSEISNNDNGCAAFQVALTNADPNLVWTLYPSPFLFDVAPNANPPITPVFPSSTSYPPSGQIGAQTGFYVGTVSENTGVTNSYCQPQSIPVYTGAALLQAQSFVLPGFPQGIPQGDVLMVVGVPLSPSVPLSACVLPNAPGCATTYQMFQTYGGVGGPLVNLYPSTPPGDTSIAAVVPHGTSFQFNGFVVGTSECSANYPSSPPTATKTNCLINGLLYPANYADNGTVWTVGTNTTNGVVGGSAATGFISPQGLYTAPPAPAGTVIVSVLSHNTQSLLKSAYVSVP